MSGYVVVDIGAADAMALGALAGMVDLPPGGQPGAALVAIAEATMAGVDGEGDLLRVALPTGLVADLLEAGERLRLVVERLTLAAVS